jgi:hypothetical protein
MAAYTIKFRLGDAQIEISADNERDLFDRATLFGEIPRQCGNCESTQLWPRHRIAQGRYHYYEVVCMACNYRAKVGQTQDSGALFCRGEWEPPYVPDEAADRHEAQPPRRDTGRVPSAPPQPAPPAQRDYPKSYGQGKPYGQR